ncbi:MAG: toll/interleukin-1 receptor domain-containing protein [Methylococcaceae bacterium]
MWDVFISHASEDKNSVARPLAIALQTHGLTTWFDIDSMFAHDPLNQKIVEGLRSSQIIVLIISSRFLSKEWTTREMTLAIELEDPPDCVVIPIFHNLTDEDIQKIPATLRDRPGVSTRESLEEAIVRLVGSIRSIRNESLTGWIHFTPDGWPIRHMFEDWLRAADKHKSFDIEPPQIAWPSELFICINKTERFGDKLVLAAPDPETPDWFDFQGTRLRGMDIEICRSAPIRAREMMELCPVRAACLAAGLKSAGDGYWYATYAGRTFLYLALKEIYRTVNHGAYIAGGSLPTSSFGDDILAMPVGRICGEQLGSVLVTSDSVSEMIKPYLSGGNELSVTGRVDHLQHLQLNTNGGPWMDFFEDFLVPQIELRLLIFGIRSTLQYSCDRKSWRFRRFRDENDKII